MSKHRTYLDSGSGVNLALLREVLRRDLLDKIGATSGSDKVCEIQNRECFLTYVLDPWLT
jgi:hypothetical protein